MQFMKMDEKKSHEIAIEEPPNIRHDEVMHDEVMHDEIIHDEVIHDEVIHDEVIHDEVIHGEVMHDETPSTAQPGHLPENSTWIAILTYDDFHPRNNNTGDQPVEKAYKTLEFFESVNNFFYMIHMTLTDTETINETTVYGTWKIPTEEINEDYHFLTFIQEDNTEVTIDMYKIDAISINMKESVDISTVYEQYMKDEMESKSKPRKRTVKGANKVAKTTKKSSPRKCIEIAGNSKKRCKQNALADSEYCWLHEK